MSDREYLQLAVDEAAKCTGKWKFGAVVVLDGEIIAKDHNHTAEHNDPSAHAEVSVLRRACGIVRIPNIPGATLFASGEPCMMCLCCAAWAEVDRIVFAERADDMSENMYEFKNAEFSEIAAKLVRPIKTEHLPL